MEGLVVQTLGTKADSGFANTGGGGGGGGRPSWII